MLKQFWTDLSAQARAGLAAGVVLVCVATAALGWWAMRANYQVLFTSLAAADAAAMVAEIEKMKVPYRLEDGGTTILVPDELVHRTRLKLAGQELPLHGAVGLELFNNSEIGMTEFAQKINYQRAQQGELTRTILAIEEVQAARVHLALPEQGLFKKGGSGPKASIALTLKPGRVLQPAQVRGIARLVAAAIPEIRPEDVTILDQHGLALSAVAGADGADVPAALEGKRSTEEYLVRKLAEVLDQNFGAGQAIATVDVELNRDQSRVTTEDVLPGRAAGAQSGLVVRERRTNRDGAGAAAAQGEAAVTSTEADYQVGRRVEQTIGATGGIKRLNAVVVVKKDLSLEQAERVRDMAALAVGFDKARGDAIAVYSIDQVAGRMPAPELAVPAAVAPAPADPGAPPAAPAGASQQVVAWLGALLALALLAGAVGAVRGRRRAAAAAPRLSDEQRARALDQVNAWLAAAPDHAGAPQ